MHTSKDKTFAFLWSPNRFVCLYAYNSKQLLLPLALQPFVGFGFLRQVITNCLTVGNSFQFLTFSTFRSSHTSSNHLNLGLPSDRLPIGFNSNILFAILEVSILCMWPQPFNPLGFDRPYNICSIN
jgi:hypothetical protein